MKILLDTQIVIWWNTESSKIAESAREMIRDPSVKKLVVMQAFGKWQLKFALAN